MFREQAGLGELSRGENGWSVRRPNAGVEKISDEVQFGIGYGARLRVEETTELARPALLRVRWRMINLPACNNPKKEKS